MSYGIGYANLYSCASLGNVVSRLATVALLEEVDATCTALAATAIKTQRVNAEGIHTHTDGALGKARGKCTQEALAPFGFILLMVFIVAADIRVTRQHVQMTVFDKTFCISLIVGHGLGGTKHAQCKQTYPFVQHFIFLISE